MYLKHLQKHLKTVVKHMQHPNKTHLQHTSEKTYETLEHKLATYVYNHCDICNIPIYFCNIHIKYLQHAYETPETLKHTLATHACNIRGRMQPEKHAPGLATPDILMSRAEVEHRGDAGVTLPRRDELRESDRWCLWLTGAARRLEAFSRCHYKSS